MPSSQSIPVTMRTRHYSPALSSFEPEATGAMSLVIGVARERSSKLVGHINSDGHWAFATLNREAYAELWKSIWSAHSGRIVLAHDGHGKITSLTFATGNAL